MPVPLCTKPANIYDQAPALITLFFVRFSKCIQSRNDDADKKTPTKILDEFSDDESGDSSNDEYYFRATHVYNLMVNEILQQHYANVWATPRDWPISGKLRALQQAVRGRTPMLCTQNCLCHTAQWPNFRFAWVRSDR